MLIMCKQFYFLFIPHGPGSRVKKKSSMVGLRLFGYMSQSVLRIQVRKRPLSLSKVAFSSLYEMALPVLKTKIYDHFLIQLYPQLVRKIVSETNFGHCKVVISPPYLKKSYFFFFSKFFHCPILKPVTSLLQRRLRKKIIHRLPKRLKTQKKIRV